MLITFLLRAAAVVLLAVIPLSSCSTPTLVEIARRRQASGEDLKANQSVKDDVRVKYYIADLDVLNFTDEVKRKLANRSHFHIGFAYGTSATQATLGALAGAAQTIGWGVSAASGLGLGATYVFGIGRIFDPKANAQAYEQSFTAIQAAEATYYFYQLGMGFDPVTGRVLSGNRTGRDDIPSPNALTPDGETLYYRVSKILKVLNDTLAGKVPDLQDLKDAQGESTVAGSPAKPVNVPPGSNVPSYQPAIKVTDEALSKALNKALKERDVRDLKAEIKESYNKLPQSVRDDVTFYPGLIAAGGGQGNTEQEYLKLKDSLQDLMKLKAMLDYIKSKAVSP